jgi:hypothetical protein
VRTIDTGAQPIAYAGASVSAETLKEVRAKLAVLRGCSCPVGY